MGSPTLSPPSPQHTRAKRLYAFAKAHHPHLPDMVLLALGAFLYTVAYPPYAWAGAAWITLTPLFLVLRGRSPRAGFVAGLVFGVFSCIGVTAWVHFAIAAYFALPFPLDVLCTFLSYLCFGGVPMGIVSALTCLVLRSFAQGRVPVWLRWAVVPALWVCGEYIRSSLVTGFSWGVLGYTQYPHLALIQIADVTGVYGLSFVLAFTSDVAAEALIALGFLRHRFQQQTSTPVPWIVLGGCLSTAVVFLSLYGAYRIRHHMEPPSAMPLRVALVQGNVPGEQRWQQMFYGSTLLTYLSVTRQHLNGAKPDLVVWPEFALGFHLDKEPRLRAQLNWFTKELDTFLLLGAPRVEQQEGVSHFYNSAYLLAPGGTLVDVYDKKQLVPFAEYRLPLFPALVPHTPDAPSEFTPGTRATVFALPHSKFGVMICYEVTYPDLARGLVRNGAQFLVNISNDTWLSAGGEAAAAQHFALAVFRAVENRRVLVRVATQGISGFVDPVGYPFQTASLREGAMTGRVIPSDTMTLYARYGDWFVGLCIILALVALSCPLLFGHRQEGHL